MPAPCPTPAFIARAIEGVQKAGHAPAGVRVWQDGSVEVRIARVALPGLPSPPEAGEEMEDCDDILRGVKAS